MVTSVIIFFTHVHVCNNLRGFESGSAEKMVLNFKYACDVYDNKIKFIVLKYFSV